MDQRYVLIPSALDAALLEDPAEPGDPGRVVSFVLAGCLLRVATDDEGLVERLATTLGSPVRPLADPLPTLDADVRLTVGHGRVRLASERAWDSDDLVLGLLADEFPFERLPAEPGWLSLGFRGEGRPFLSFRGPDCVFSLDPRWRTGVALFLFHRLLRMRTDLLFFHAASLSTGGRGALLVGPKGAGKSTTALALAARGHGLLGDETAAYSPADRTLLPMRRPVGIKPGPRARAVAAAIDRATVDPQADGILRVDVDALLATRAPVSAPLRAVAFLRGFAARPRLEIVQAGRQELAALQPLASCLVDASPARRVFELVRLFEGLRVYHLWPGDPDETADILEEAL